MTPAVWKIAEKCWHQEAKKRPEVNAVLQHLEDLANPGTCAHKAGLLSKIGDLPANTAGNQRTQTPLLQRWREFFDG